MVDEKKFLLLAERGDVDGILDLAGAYLNDDEDYDDEDDESAEGDDLAYKWLLISSDFGHKKAGEAADDMLESSSLRYDDGQMRIGLIHLEIAEQYLSGKEILPANIAHAKRHLAIAKKLEVHKTTNVAKDFNAIRRRLPTEAQVVFNSFFPPTKNKAKKR